MAFVYASFWSIGLWLSRLMIHVVMVFLFRRLLSEHIFIIALHVRSSTIALRWCISLVGFISFMFGSLSVVYCHYICRLWLLPHGIFRVFALASCYVL